VAKRDSRRVPVKPDILLPNGTPSQPFAEREVAHVLEKNPPTVAPDERRDLAVGQDKQASAPTTLAM
jgi:hypothetical protein